MKRTDILSGDDDFSKPQAVQLREIRDVVLAAGVFGHVEAEYELAHKPLMMGVKRLEWRM